MIAVGVPGGADTAIQVIEVTPGIVSAMVGTLGYSFSRLVSATAIILILPASMLPLLASR